jgi:hypothetical protein
MAASYDPKRTLEPSEPVVKRGSEAADSSVMTVVRDTVTYAYMHGGASLMDFLNAQSDYRAVQLAYLQLVGAYMTAAGQMNLAVGREVIP